MEGRNVGTIGGGGSPEQGLISAKDLPMQLPEGTNLNKTINHKTLENKMALY